MFAVDGHLEPGLTRVVEADLRRQLDGLRLDGAAVGTAFEVRDARLPGHRVLVRLTALPAPGVVVDDRTSFEFSAEASPPAAPGPGAPSVEVPPELAQYASVVVTVPPDDAQALARSAARIDGLLGIPKDAVIADVVSRLRGRGWLAEWSRRHYGRLIPGADDVLRSTSFVLLTGDPGTGKSVLVHHLPPVAARRLNRPVLFVQLSERLRGSGIQGRAGTDVVGVLDAIGRMAERYGLPTVVFLDEAEAVASSRGSTDGSSGAQENVAVVDALIVGLDRVFARTDIPVVFVMATNLAGRMDPAVLRRATVYRFERPSAADRHAILVRALGDAVDMAVLEQVAAALERPEPRLTAADLLNQVIVRAVREAAHHDRPIDPEHLLHLARTAVATAPVAGG
ncbi:AAA family ATPase [Sphaerisporangium album]|uniref:AAA family ATPase n=1 Tax=Sphaerisporangium album TaxID=509200 RepID=A0A367FD26_9ACTN|nr:AAA family ATPase [Sphaerisporangium album]